MNRLAGSTSPYLLQHAENPVDWYPWGDEAFARAEAEDKPLLVSVGYPVSIALGRMPLESLQWFTPVATVATGPSLLVVPAFYVWIDNGAVRLKRLMRRTRVTETPATPGGEGQAA